MQRTLLAAVLIVILLITATLALTQSEVTAQPPPPDGEVAQARDGPSLDATVMTRHPQTTKYPGAPDLSLSLPASADSPAAGAITGRLVANNAAVAGASVDLRLWNGSTESTVLTATTNGNGSYTFPNPPALASGSTYYVRYGPNPSNPAYVYIWFGPDITSYSAGQTLNGADINIAAVPLLTPPDGTTATAPTTFTWTKRATTTDWYRVGLFAADTGSGWLMPTVYYNDSYTLQSTTPLTGFQFGKDYVWTIRIYDSTDVSSFGETLDQHHITFTQSVAATQTPTPSTTLPPGATATRTPSPAPNTTSTRTITPTPTTCTVQFKTGHWHGAVDFDVSADRTHVTNFRYAETAGSACAAWTFTAPQLPINNCHIEYGASTSSLIMSGHGDFTDPETMTGGASWLCGSGGSFTGGGASTWWAWWVPNAATTTPTPTASVTPTPTGTPIPTLTPTASSTSTPTATGTSTLSPTASATTTATTTSMPTLTATTSPSATVTRTPTATSTPTATPGPCSQPHCLLLPLIMKRGNEALAPDALTLSFSLPTRDTIRLTWSAAARATAYRLWQLNAPGGPQVLYAGADLSVTLPGQAIGAYSFSVDALNMWGATASNTVIVVIQPPPTPTPTLTPVPTRTPTPVPTACPAPRTGRWEGNGVSFTVSNDRTQVTNFQLTNETGCGSVTVSAATIAINNCQFSASGQSGNDIISIEGNFTSPTTVDGRTRVFYGTGACFGYWSATARQ